MKKDKTMVRRRFFMKYPSAWIPPVMSCVAFVLPFVSLAFYGNTPQSDENAFARLFQLLIMGQLPIILYLVMKYAQKFPRPTIYTLCLQIIFLLIPIAFILLLESMAN